jgi:FkbM family methyltransferase
VSAFLDRFDRERAPRLGLRASTFRRVFEELESQRRDFYTFVETGVGHAAASDGSPGHFGIHGQATLLFDEFVNAHDGIVYSIDLSAEHCERAARWVSGKVRILCHDSVAFLAGFDPPTRIDCLYLDSVDVDWSDPHPSALHHMAELCAILPRLGEGCLVIADDTPGEAGKGGYLVELMQRIGARKLFNEYQIGWQLTAPGPAMRAWGHYDRDELAFVLDRSTPRRYRYLRRGLDERVLELLPDGRIGLGRAPSEELWYAARLDDGRIGIVLAGGGRVSARLAPGGPDDHWEGTLAGHPAAVALTPLPAEAQAAPAGRYRLRPGDAAARRIELLESHDVRRGSGSPVHTWRTSAGEAGPELILSGAGRDVCRLVAGPQGWAGWSAGDPRTAVLLEPLGPVRESERSLRDLLAARRHFRHSRAGDGEWPVDFNADGSIGRGATDTEAGWDVEDDGEGEVSLLLESSTGVITRLAPLGDGSFAGVWPLHGHPTVRVEPLDLGSGAYLLPVFTACLPRDQVRRVIEAGSGNGTDAIALHRYFDAEVIAVECNPEFVPLCEHRTAPYPRVTFVGKAAGDHDGPVPFYSVVNGNPYASSCYRANPAYPYEQYEQSTRQVEMIRLERWLDEHGIEAVDLLALDVQGACLDILRGLGRHLARVRFIIAELATQPLYHGEPLADEVISFLDGHGFHLLRCFNQWGFTPDGRQVEGSGFVRPFANSESWFGDYLFVRWTPAERAAASALVAERRFHYIRLGHDQRAIELLEHGRIGEGAGDCERHWNVQEQPGGTVELHLLGDELVTCRLVAGNDGRWRGRWTSHERMPVLLEPVAHRPRAHRTGSPAAGADSRAVLDVQGIGEVSPSPQHAGR